MTTEIIQEQKKSAFEIMQAIMIEANPSLPALPLENATGLDLQNHALSVMTAIANWHEPSEDHPRYWDYQRAKQEWESNFRLKPEDLFKEFTV